MWPNPQFPVIIHQSISFKSFPNPTKNIPRILLICKKNTSGFTVPTKKEP